MYWSSNKLTIEGDTQAVELVNSLISRVDNKIDFNIVKPIPKAYGRFHKTTKDGFVLRKDNPNRIGALQPRNIQQHLNDLFFFSKNKSYCIDSLSACFKERSWIKPDQAIELSIEEVQDAYNTYDENHNDYKKSILNDPFIKELIDAMKAEQRSYCADMFGSSTAYSWCMKNWDTNKGIDQLGYESTPNLESNEVCITYSFEGLYVPPMAWFDTLIDVIRSKGVSNIKVLLTHADKLTELGRSWGIDFDGKSIDRDIKKREGSALIESNKLLALNKNESVTTQLKGRKAM